MPTRIQELLHNILLIQRRCCIVDYTMLYRCIVDYFPEGFAYNECLTSKVNIRVSYVTCDIVIYNITTLGLTPHFWHRDHKTLPISKVMRAIQVSFVVLIR